MTKFYQSKIFSLGDLFLNVQGEMGKLSFSNFERESLLSINVLYMNVFSSSKFLEVKMSHLFDCLSLCV